MNKDGTHTLQNQYVNEGKLNFATYVYARENNVKVPKGKKYDSEGNITDEWQAYKAWHNDQGEDIAEFEKSRLEVARSQSGLYKDRPVTALTTKY